MTNSNGQCVQCKAEMFNPGGTLRCQACRMAEPFDFEASARRSAVCAQAVAAREAGMEAVFGVRDTLLGVSGAAINVAFMPGRRM